MRLSTFLSTVAIVLVLALGVKYYTAPSLGQIEEKLTTLSNDIQPLREMAQAFEEGFGDGAAEPVQNTASAPVLAQAQVEPTSVTPANQPDNKWKRIVQKMKQSWSTTGVPANPLGTTTTVEPVSGPNLNQTVNLRNTVDNAAAIQEAARQISGWRCSERDSAGSTTGLLIPATK